MNDVRSGQCKILMVSVERFKNERFRQFIESVQVSMLVVDEAHCIYSVSTSAHSYCH